MEFKEFLTTREQSLIKVIGEQNWAENKVYFIDEINSFVEEWQKANDLSRKIQELEAQGVYIHLQHEHYKNGSNCNWAIEFLDENRVRKYHTGWYGDNHEFGDTIGCYEAAFRLAKFFLEGDNAKWFFLTKIETVTPEGYANWLKYREAQEAADEAVFGKKNDNN